MNNYGRDSRWSVSPKKAVVSIQCQRGTSYKAYIEVRDEISKAYTELRNNEAQSLYGKDFTELKVKEAGKLNIEGKDYIVKDGDVMHFRFNV